MAAGSARDPAPDDGRLQWLLVGTGPVGGGDPPANRGVLLMREGGHEILRYDKQFDFTLTPEIIRKWRLEALGPGPTLEDIRPGGKVVIREGALGRVAIVICEDLSRPCELLGQFGVSHLFVPVFSAPLRIGSWERWAADRHVDEFGGSVIVANSLAVGRAQELAGKLGTCVCIMPTDEDRAEYRKSHPTIGAADAPDEVVLLWVDGGAVTRYEDFDY